MKTKKKFSKKQKENQKKFSIASKNNKLKKGVKLEVIKKPTTQKQKIHCENMRQIKANKLNPPIIINQTKTIEKKDNIIQNNLNIKLSLFDKLLENKIVFSFTNKEKKQEDFNLKNILIKIWSRLNNQLSMIRKNKINIKTLNGRLETLEEENKKSKKIQSNLEKSIKVLEEKERINRK